MPQQLALSTIRQAVESGYQLRDVTVSPLPGWAPTNFKIENHQHEFFLRLYQPADEAAAHFHAALLVHYQNHSVPIASVIPEKSGGLVLSMNGYHYLLQKYLSAQPLSKLTITEESLAEAGRVLGRIHQCGGLKGSICPYVENLWNMENIEQLLLVIEQEQTKFSDDAFEALQSFIQHWRRGRPNFEVMERTFIHNDFHPDNMLFDGNSCKAVIDFEIAVPGCRVVDVAVALMYFSILELPPKGAFASFLRGYSEVKKLSQDEHLLLPILIKARAVISFALNLFEQNRTRNDLLSIIVDENLESYLQ